MDEDTNEFSEMLKYQRVQKWQPVIRYLFEEIHLACNDVLALNDSPLDLEIRVKIDKQEVNGVVMSTNLKTKFTKSFKGVSPIRYRMVN